MTDFEIELNTKNKQFKKTNYLKNKWNNVLSDLRKVVETLKPDIIFSSAISSHIHGEGEYINFEYTYDLVEKIDYEGLIIFGGLQATADPERILRLMPKINFLVSGESELVLGEIAKLYPKK